MIPVIDALDRIDQIAACQEAVSDLLIPETDLHVVNRDKLALLLSFLLIEHRIARDQLAKALQSGKVANIRSAG
jgi:hypothetical protein